MQSAMEPRAACVPEMFSVRLLGLGSWLSLRTEMHAVLGPCLGFGGKSFLGHVFVCDIGFTDSADVDWWVLLHHDSAVIVPLSICV